MDVTGHVDAARAEAQEHLATFARRVEEAVVRDLAKGVNPFLASVGTHVDALASETAATLEKHTASFTTRGEGERVRLRFGREARLAFAPILAYSKGFVDGGRKGSPADLVGTLVNSWAEPALVAWYDRVIEDLSAALESGDAAAPGPAPAPPKPTEPVALDLHALLEQANALGIRIKNVPENPSRKYLEKLAEQLSERQKKAPPPATPRTAAATDRLGVLLAFSEELKVRVKSVPDHPSDAWMSKMEEKLKEVAARKGVPLPPSLGGGARGSATPVPAAPAVAPSAPPPPELPDDALGTPALAPDRHVGGGTTGVEALAPEPPVDDGRRERVEALLEKAAEAGLELGRIPTAPSDTWIGETEQKLEAAIEKRKAARKAERKKKEAERQGRIQQLREKADRFGVDLGAFPPFPTDDWIARAEVRIQTAALGPTAHHVDDTGRAARLQKLLADAEAAGVELGELPPDPDDVWLTWAESEVDKKTSGGDAAIALLSEGFDAPTATLVYEEGTVQEQSWTVDADTAVTVGRGRGNTVHVRDDAGVSRQHFSIRSERGRYYLKDEGSTKGTFVSGKRAHQDVELQGDEVITAGETQFVFRVR